MLYHAILKQEKKTFDKADIRKTINKMHLPDALRSIKRHLGRKTYQRRSADLITRRLLVFKKQNIITKFQ